MERYSVKQLSKLSGISIRTLHHYDQIGLLRPAARTEKGYRYYERKELLKLQQILFYKTLDFPLKEIAGIVNDPDFDQLTALQSHKKELQKKGLRLEKMMQTIDKTIQELKSGKEMRKEEIYEGFQKEEVEAMRKEVTERWSEQELLAAEARIRNLGQEGWQDTKKKEADINRLLADLMDLDPASLPVQKAVALHFRHMNTFYPVTKERYLGLSGLYVADERFKAHYEQYREGLAVFLQQAMEVFCDNGLQITE